jgi:hypothetical protein
MLIKRPHDCNVIEASSLCLRLRLIEVLPGAASWLPVIVYVSNRAVTVPIRQYWKPKRDGFFNGTPRDLDSLDITRALFQGRPGSV